MKIIKLISNLLQSNTYIIEKNNQVVIIDCGCQVEKVKQVVEDKKVLAVLLTHGHYDHSAYCNDYAKEFGCNIYASEKIGGTLTDKIAIYSENYSTIKDLSSFKYVKNEQNFKLGSFEILCYEFPGHSPCSIGFLIDKNFFVGDFLFEKSFGRIDLKNGNREEMLKSFDRFEKVDFEKVFSGHGEESLKIDQINHLKVFRKFLGRKNQP